MHVVDNIVYILNRNQIFLPCRSILPRKQAKRHKSQSFYRFEIIDACLPEGRGRRLFVLLAVERELVCFVRVPRVGDRGRGAARVRGQGGGGGGGEQGVASVVC